MTTSTPTPEGLERLAAARQWGEAVRERNDPNEIMACVLLVNAGVDLLQRRGAEQLAEAARHGGNANEEAA